MFDEKVQNNNGEVFTIIGERDEYYLLAYSNGETFTVTQDEMNKYYKEYRDEDKSKRS